MASNSGYLGMLPGTVNDCCQLHLHLHKSLPRKATQAQQTLRILCLLKHLLSPIRTLLVLFGRCMVGTPQSESIPIVIIIVVVGARLGGVLSKIA